MYNSTEFIGLDERKSPGGSWGRRGGSTNKPEKEEPIWTVKYQEDRKQMKKAFGKGKSD